MCRIIYVSEDCDSLISSTTSFYFVPLSVSVLSTFHPCADRMKPDSSLQSSLSPDCHGSNSQHYLAAVQTEIYIKLLFVIMHVP
jgi:hypothetical protein